MPDLVSAAVETPKLQCHSCDQIHITFLMYDHLGIVVCNFHESLQNGVPPIGITPAVLSPPAVPSSPSGPCKRILVTFRNV